MTDIRTETSYAGLLRTGREALARGVWDEARARFEAAIAQEETPEALEGLGLAAWWLDDGPATFDARERAYRLYRERGDRPGAARVAVWLSWDYGVFRGEGAVAAGWLGRAHRLLEGLDPCPEQAWLALHEAADALMGRGDTAVARELAARATTLGRTLGDLDLEMAGLALEGLALVAEGSVAEGMRRLDESAAAVAGEMSDLTLIGVSCCYMIDACERVRDFDRAAHWCDRLKEFCRRWRIRPLFAVCRTRYAAVLMWRGAWLDADAELSAAVAELAATRPAQASECIVRLAELRRRQGRWEEAEALFAQAESQPPALLGRAALALDRGDAAGATHLIERYLRRLPPEDRTERAAGLELLVRARCALDDRDGARAALAELDAVADTVATAPLRASAAFAAGGVASARGDHQAARRRFEDAVDLFERSGAPFETGRARLHLAGALHALERHAAACQEARAALETFERIGAAREAEHAAALLHEPEQAPAHVPGSAAGRAGLTARELEVLRLVAQGLSNQEIAVRLVLSGHTVHRHVANILNRLGLPSRAAAAHAARLGLL